jgi:hypothetical protein
MKRRKQKQPMMMMVLAADDSRAVIDEDHGNTWNKDFLLLGSHKNRSCLRRVVVLGICVVLLPLFFKIS